MSINGPEIQQARAMIAELARDMLEGRLSFIEGTRALLSLREKARLSDSDPDFNPFVAIDSETLALPLGEIRALWAPAALAKLQPDIERAERLAAEFGRSYCQKLIERFENSGS